MSNNFLTNLSELTDVDSKLLRTAFHLFIKPRQVLEDKKGHYSSALRYALTLIGAFLFLIFLADSIFYEDGFVNYWRVPLRLQEHIKLKSDIEEDFSGIILMIGTIPAFWILSKLFFFKKRSLSYFLNLSLYLLTQLTIISVLFYFISTAYVGDTSLPFAIINITYFFYFVINIKMESWYLTIIKFAISAVLAIISFNAIWPFSHNLITILFKYPEKEYSIELADKSLFINKAEKATDFTGYADILSAGDNAFYFIDYYRYGVGFFDFNTNKNWHHPIIRDGEYQRVISLLTSSENNILVVTGESDSYKEDFKFLKLYSRSGKELFHFNFDDDILIFDIQLIASDTGSFELLIPNQGNGLNQYEYQKMSFVNINNKWSHHFEDYLNLNLRLSSISNLNDQNKIGAVVSKPDIHYANFGMARYDSTWNLLWHTNIYDKSNPYDPIVPIQYIISEESNEIITQHSLANDTLVFCIITSLNLENGTLLWRKEINIPADFTEFHTLGHDDNYIYLAGESHKEISKWPWKPRFHAGFIAKLDRSSGELISYKHFGNKSMDGHTRFSTFTQTDSSLQLIGVEEENTPFSLESANRKHFIWEIKKGDI
ncbi:hypothetical protein [Fulvivirga lutimaris]|uniref:hypothetical protein n=1 Tax=Fulvivirga lutimaris TaxID=1819566 RepID=UPI0012BD11E3|nr:hypothetical protein [Fulvivirga lutimaris]MTI39492.1 hypothetical protein [Fulvivirga lutimaris]